MPAAMTYGSLQTDIQAYLERGASLSTDPAVYLQIPNFIGLAERRLARELKTLGTIVAVSSAMQAGVAVYDKPDRWRTTVSMHIGTGEDFNTTAEVYPRAYEYARAYWSDATVTDTPRFYADYDYQHWFIVPTPDEDYPLEILYNQLPALLSDETETNWFTSYVPDALLYASLLEAQPFLKNPDMMVTWQGFYDRALAAHNGENMARFMDRGIKRDQT